MSLPNPFAMSNHRFTLTSLLAGLLFAGQVSAAPWFRLKNEGDVEKPAATQAVGGYQEPKVLEVDLPDGPAMLPANLSLMSPPPAGNPLAPFWNDREFVKRYAGLYGVNSKLEPELNKSTNFFGGSITNSEINFYLKDVRGPLSTNAEAAITLLKSTITAGSSGVFDFLLAHTLGASGKFEEAVPHYQAAIDKFPDYLRAHQGLAMSYVRLSQFKDAIAPLTKVVELGGADGMVYGMLGFCLMERGAYVGAEGAYRNAMVFMPDSKDWKMGLVNCQIAQGKLAEATKMVDEMILENPSEASLWGLQARIYLQQEKTTEAAINYEMMRKLGGMSLADLMLLGDIYMSQEAVSLALPVYLEGIEKSGVSDLKRSLRAASQLASRANFDEASSMAAKIREAHGAGISGNDELELLKLESRIALGTGQTEKAVAVLEQVITRNPLDGEALMMVGDHYANSDEAEKAKFKFELAEKIEGYAADANVKLAQLAVKRGKFDEAVTYLTKAQKIEPRDRIQRYLEAIERARDAQG